MMRKRLQGRQNLQQVVKNTGWLLADRIFRMGFSLVVSVWVARYLGVEKFGIYNFAIAFAGLFIPFSTLGLPELVVREIVTEPGKKEEILGTTFFLKLLGGITMLVLAIGSITMLRKDDPLTISLVAVFASVGIFQAFNTIDLWFQSQVQSKYTVISNNVAFLLTTLARIILISIYAPLIAFAGISLASAVIVAISLVVLYKLQGSSILAWRWRLPVAKKLLKESWPLILSGLTVVIYMRVDQIMLGQMADTEAVGLYSSAVRISEVWYFIPTALASSVAPGIYAAKKAGNNKLYHRRLGQLLRLMSCIAILLAVPMTVLSGTIITTLFGNEFAAAGAILAIHIWAALFVFMGVGSSSWFIAEGLTSVRLKMTVLGAVANLMLNYFLIPLYGGVGAAIATVISQAIAAFLGNACFSETRKIFQMQLYSIIPLDL